VVDISPGRVTQLLKDWQNGDGAALDELLPLVHGELRRQARHCLKNERPGHSLTASDLIQDAYLRLAGHRDDWRDRTYFFAATVATMRRILVDHARRHATVKRGGAPQRINLESVVLVSQDNSAIVLSVHEAVGRLAALWPRRARIVELRFFAGLTEIEIATAEGVAVETVRRDWRAAKAWLAEMIDAPV
jgi:RNA polymerase sigma factor (TIGR02999 family)